MSKKFRYLSRREWAAFWEECDREFLEGLPRGPALAGRYLEALVGVIVRTDGPELDYSIKSLRALGHWYVALARADFDGEEWLGMIPRPEPPEDDGILDHHTKHPERELSWTLQVLEVAMGAYCGRIERGLIPQARHVVWRGRHADDSHNGSVVLDVGDPLHPHMPATSVRGLLGQGYQYYFDDSVEYYWQKPDPEAMAKWVERELDERRRFVERNGSPVWQVAPTGPRAFEGRTPMKRVPVRLIDAYNKGELGVPTVYRGPEPPPDPDPQIGM
ncbi:MAG: hypothetical protein LBK95_09400 [Bifidobacteriaceae bacterium]|jgi:hypothetical protein|nr:hypothetical protein [Bifidobacteriaceae bacterium]